MVLIDDRGVDGVVVGISVVISRISVRLRRWQTGFARTYALSILTGTAVVIATLLMVRTW
jgi:NADH-quinone oxidoreductase subunit L